MKKLLVIITVGILSGCSGKQKADNSSALQDTQKSIPVLDLAAVINNEVPDTFTWNSIAKKVTLVPISTDANTLIGEGPGLLYIGDEFYYMISYQTQTYYKIGKNGKIINTFRHEGNGPGEYAYSTYTHIDTRDSTIQVFDNGNLKRIYYDLNGKFIKEVSLQGKEVVSPTVITDNYMIMRGEPEGKNQYFITDPEMNIRERLCPFDTALSTREKAAIYLQSARKANRDMMIFNQAPEDSVFTITDKSLEPLFILKKGEYAIPDAEVKNFIELIRKGDSHILMLGISSLPGHYLISYSRNKESIEEVWSKQSNQVISRFKNREGAFGLPFVLPSGKKIRIGRSSIYINGNQVGLFIPADVAAGEIPGVKEDDNPVLLIMEL